ncbi:MAG: hypothetical protein HGB10_01435 [Coriobacteriia bacterium]|nr:hypothetical protein [Coriobacteriia bacterium]
MPDTSVTSANRVTNDNAPLRAELLSAERLMGEARALATEQDSTTAGRIKATPLITLAESAASSLSADNRELSLAARDRGATPPAGEWLLDNYYLIEEQVLLVRADLPSHYGLELPRLVGGRFADFPRIYEAVLSLVAHTDSRLDEEFLTGFVHGYQEVAPLTIGEVWAVPIMLRIALVENLSRLSRAVVASQRAEIAADEWAERLVLTGQDAPDELGALLGQLDAATRKVAAPFFVRLSQRLGDLEHGGDAINAWLERRLLAEGIVLEAASALAQQEQAANQVSIANSITSIRLLDALDWREFFESVSLVEAALRHDPARTYSAMDFESRDRYRHAVEEIARRSEYTELGVTEALMELSRAALAVDASDGLRGHVGWWLVDDGRLELESQVGYRPRKRERFYRNALVRQHGLFYWGNIIVLTGVLLGMLTLYARSEGAATWQVVVLAVLGVVPSVEIALVVVNRLASLVFPPKRLAKLDFRKPVDESHRTLVVVPALLSSVGSTREVIGHLEITYLSNRDENLGFALLGDVRAHSEEVRDDDAEILDAARSEIEALNERYAAEHGVRPFHLLVRARRYNASEGSWMGWERKRGALLELVRDLRGRPDVSFSVRLGDAAFRRSCAFVLTLDADTVLPRDGGRRLVSAIAHPLNRARWRPGDPHVREGYGLVQPRVGMTLEGAHRSRFATLYSGPTGIDPYAGAVSDTYQDVFGEGSFTGKGIFEVDVFEGVLEGRFEENSLLSHDLVEGSFLRTALASDIEVLDDYPANYLAAASRLHRWVRGDWQTIPWLLGKVKDAHGARVHNPLTRLHRWKITDNLRRSLFAPAMLVLAVAGWWLLPEASLSWPLIVAAVLLFPAYFSLADSMIFRPKSVGFVTTAPSVLRDFATDTWRAVLTVAALPYQAWLMLDAIVRALWRMGVSHKLLLEWETAADAEKRAGRTKSAFFRAMGPANAAAALVLASGVAAPMLAVADKGHAVLIAWERAGLAIPFLAAWLGGPLLTWWLSQPEIDASPEALPDGGRGALRRIARKTWRFFDTFVVDRGHSLAPDNYQEDPGGVVAWRTSPTNIGLQLLSFVNAHDLGYVTIAELESRVASTLAAMAGLERYRGHFYNWYDIETLAPLRPTYISTVDSGNLAGHLLVLRVALLEATEAPLLGPQVIDGARDAVLLALEDLVAEQAELPSTLDAHRLREALDSLLRTLDVAEPPGDLSEWWALLERLGSLADGVAAALGPIQPPLLADGEPHVPATPVERLAASVGDALDAVRAPRTLLGAYAPWAPLLASAPESLRSEPALEPLAARVPSLAGLAEGLDGALAALDVAAGAPAPDVAEWAASVAAGIREARPVAGELLARMRLSTEIAREMWEHTDFGMLYDPHRQLFSIGFNLNEGRLDASYYDLLASECRLASFLAIAKGDVSQEHWFRLGRSLTKVRGGRALVSWSASMFEYLMPLLVMRDWPQTLLSETYDTVVAAQIAYGDARGVPWGVSESAFNAKDAELTYQYQAFGVPGLGLKRGLSDDVVVAPYASIIALPIDPSSVIANLSAFSSEGAEGRFGYYEALDYTPGRVPAGQRRAVVASYFAHHQGMAFLALGNALCGGRMRDRFHEDPVVGSAELLLQERVPRHIELVTPHAEEVENLRSVRDLPPPVARTYTTADTMVPATHFLSNGRYSVMVTNGGGGYSRWNGVAVTRYREDVTRDCWGTFFYVRDVESGEVFSAPHNPHPTRPKRYSCVFSPDKAEFSRHDGDLETHVEVSVSPEDDVEVRRLTITNHGLSERTLEVTSYFEIALALQGSDQAHKSFSNLFVETDWLPETNAVLFTRRPRSAHEQRFWGLHVLACEQGSECTVTYETDRAAFLGRLHGADSPVAVTRGGDLSCGSGSVLDPCCALRRPVTVPAGESVRLTFATGVADSREIALRLTEKYADPRGAQRAIDLAWTAAQLELRDLGISPQEAVTLERLGSRLLLTDPYSPLKIKTPVENGLQMSGLWSIGISGDLPILLVRVEEIEHAPLVRQAILAHQYWRHKGLVADLVVLNTRPTGYSDELDDRLRVLVRTGHALQLLDKPGGVYLRRIDQMHPDVANLLASVARATLEGEGGSIELQLNRRGTARPAPGALRSVPRSGKDGVADATSATDFARPALDFDNGIGGFDPATGDYVIVLEGDDVTPAPWIDVLASPGFGCMVSEAGVGCTWALNSHENRITTWNNDPVSDGSGEAIYIRDEETGEFWSPTPLPVRTPEPYVVRHGKGRVRFEHETHGIAHELDWFVPAEDPVRVCRLRLTNTGDRARQLSATQFVEWVLGDSRSRAQQLAVTWFDAETDILTAHNHFNLDFPGRCGFLATDRPLADWTASRGEFVGRNGRPSDPAAMHREGLGEVSGRYHDTCGALRCLIDLEPGQTREVSFLLGQAATLDEARTLVARYRAPGAIEGALDDALAFWRDLLGTVQVSTPDPKLDLLVNGQLLYQATACRLWGRTATYQSSGAYGFRDQLQDSMALLLARPELVREQIVEASRHQFPEGDVLHWWQPFSGRGVRTHISDDRHWLPLVVAEYLAATGDHSVLDERTAFLDAPLLAPEAEDAYVQPQASEQAASVYEHCLAAIETGRRVGHHGLPLIGGGDWNDGMNRVGHGGAGESVWLAWFIGYVISRFAPICEQRGDTDLATDYREWATRLAAAAEESWDGAWYRRAYFDDGSALGTHTDDECRIDAIAQAWATISGLGDADRAAAALDSVEEKLIRREDGLIALLAPPFDTTERDPGYIKGYLPGVRENGGQYTHAALWVVLAYLMRGDGDEAHSLLQLINPIEHALTREAAEHYVVEPYVVAADVYGAPPHTGRGGWSWYTGSASWFYRVALNSLLGIRVEAQNGERYLAIDPCIPKRWPGFTAAVREGSTLYRVSVENPRGVNRGVERVTVDGTPAEGGRCRLVDDGGVHEVTVTLLGG